MNETELKQKIEAALAEWEGKQAERVHELAPYVFYVKSVRDTVEQLLAYAKAVRENYNTVNDVPNARKNEIDSVLRRVLAVGQSMSNYLWGWGLRDEVVDIIEGYYGVQFTGLKIYSEAVHKLNGSKVYVAFRMPEIASHRVTFYHQGNWVLTSLSLAEFDSQYNMVKRS